MLKVKEWLAAKKNVTVSLLQQYYVAYDPKDYIPCAVRLSDFVSYKLNSLVCSVHGDGVIYQFDSDSIHLHIDFHFNDDSHRLYKVPINEMETTDFKPYYDA